MKLLVFTEHKDTLDYLAGDGKDGRPLGKLREWGLTVTQIHGGMKIGDRDTPGTRIYAEREFKEHAQVLVATEAAGEGINLQFCWLMINYDIPWNPVRLEQRMGRIHRYGQEHDCLIFNFVAREHQRGPGPRRSSSTGSARSARSSGTDQVFDVVGEVFPGNLLEQLFRDLYARRTNEHDIEDRIVQDVNPDRFRAITESTLEGLAKKELNLSAIVGKSVEARERRLVPEVIEDFFVEAAPESGRPPQGGRQGRPRLPRRQGAPHPDPDRRAAGAPVRAARPRLSARSPSTRPSSRRTRPWNGSRRGIRSSRSVREDVARPRRATTCGGGRSSSTSSAKEPARLDVFAASIKDGRGDCLHRRLFVVETDAVGRDEPSGSRRSSSTGWSPPRRAPRSPTTPRCPTATASSRSCWSGRCSRSSPRSPASASTQNDTVRRHVEIWLQTLIDRQNLQLADFLNRQVEGQNVPGLDGLIAQAEGHLDELNDRLEGRLRELELERHCTIADITHLGRAWVLPHPERTDPAARPDGPRRGDRADRRRGRHPARGGAGLAWSRASSPRTGAST